MKPAPRSRARRSPKRYLAQHPITLHLKRSGVTSAQLQGVRFKHQAGDTFHDWRVVTLEGWPPHLLNDLTPWAALHWLILDHPPDSPDTRDAWECVTSYMAQALVSAGSKTQQNLGRGRRTANDQRRQEADDRALTDYRHWIQQRLAVLNGHSLSECIVAYCRSPRPERRKRRIRALFKAGKIQP